MVAIPGGGRVGDIEASTPLPEATYLFRIDKCEYTPPKTEGKFPYLNLELTVIGECPDEFLGRKVWQIVTLKPGARQTLRNLLEDGLGWGQDVEFTDSDQIEIGSEVRAATTVEKGQPRDPKKPEAGNYPDRAKIAKFLPPA